MPAKVLSFPERLFLLFGMGKGKGKVWGWGGVNKVTGEAGSGMGDQAGWAQQPHNACLQPPTTTWHTPRHMPHYPLPPPPVPATMP